MKSLLFSTLFLFVICIAQAQGFGSLDPKPNQGSVCPNVKTTYWINPDVTSTNCESYLTVTNGSFAPDHSQTSKNLPAGVYVFDVYWNDNTSWGYLSVGATCMGPNFSILEKYAIRSVKGISISNAKVVSTPNICNISEIALSVDKIKIPNTGVQGVPFLEYADGYEWQLPGGWKSGGKYGTVYSTSNSISITADNGCVEGVVTVRAYVGCSGVKSFSNSAAIDLKRATVPTALSVPAGYAGQDCSSTPVKFTATNLSCATSYTWSSQGTGWSAPNNNWVTTTNSIVLTPSNFGNNGGEISVIINLDCGKAITQKYNVVQLTTAPPAPVITLHNPNREICNNETYTLSISPPAGYPDNYGFDFYTSNNGLLINNVVASSASPYHTTSKTVTVKSTSGAHGVVYIHGRMNNQVCNNSLASILPKQVGTYSSTQFSISGPSSVCQNSSQWYLSTFIDQGITNYQWGYSGVIYQSGQGTPYLGIYVPPSFSGGSITLRLANRCGLTGSPSFKQIYQGYCGYAYVVYPNPANQELTISLEESISKESLTPSDSGKVSDEVNYDVALIDSNQQVVKTGKLKNGVVILETDKLPDGLYVLHIYEPEGTIRQEVLIQH